MLLLLLIAFAQSSEGRGPAVDGSAPRPEHDLGSYLAIAAAYGSGDRAAEVRSIREWRSREIGAAVNGLRSRAMNLRPSPKDPDDIAFATVESAVLMHLEAGLLAQQTQSRAEADVHLWASTTLFEWSQVAAAEARNWAEMRRLAFAKSFASDKPEPAIRERIDRRDYYLTLAAAALANGALHAALPFADKARVAAQVDPEVQLVLGCAAESLAQEELLQHREAEAAQAREQGERALREALALDPAALEARLHLGRLLLVTGRLVEAESMLQQVEQRSGDDRQRYLARLFRGRLAEQGGRPGEAADFYRHAIETWPENQAARLGLARNLEIAAGPAAARPLVAASLADSQRADRAADPWWLYPFGPPGVAQAALARLWKESLDP